MGDLAVVAIPLLAIAGLIAAATLASGIWLGWWQRWRWQGGRSSGARHANRSQRGP